jgi:hypothetical protein
MRGIPLYRMVRQLLFRMTLCPRVGCALALALSFARASPAQEAQISFRSTPFNGPSATPLLKVDIVDLPIRTTAALPSVTVVETALGPRMSNVALKLPPMTLGDTMIASQIGDQRLPRSFSSSPWAGNVVMRPMRGLSFSTPGTTAVSVLVGELDASSRPPQSSDMPGGAALAMGVPPIKEFSVTPRALISMNSKTQTSVGTAIRAEVSPHVSFVTDVGAADKTQHGWDPLAAAGVIGHWSEVELETNLLRGASPVGTSDIATVGSLDREIVRGLVRSIPGMTISTQASWSRPASAPTSADMTVGLIGVAYDRLPIGMVTATHQDEDSSLQQSDTTSIEWRPQPVGGIVVRYIEREQTPHDRLQSAVVSKQVELELPGWIERDVRNRVDVRAVLTENPMPGTPTVSSRLSGRFDVVSDVGVIGDTEVGITSSGPSLRALRLTSKVPVLDRTAVQLVYTYQARGPYMLYSNQSFEARLLRSVPLVSW